MHSLKHGEILDLCFLWWMRLNDAVDWFSILIL